MNFKILEMEIAAISRTINDWSNENRISLVISMLEEALIDKDFELFKFGCLEIQKWFNSAIKEMEEADSPYFDPEIYTESYRCIIKINQDVYEHEEEYIEFFNSSSNVRKYSVPIGDFSKVFIVHGRDNHSKIEVARFIEKLGLEAIILHEQSSSGATIIEKIEKYTDVGFAVAIYTPCDVGRINKDGSTEQARARQNVIFEHGFLVGKLGRKNVCALVKGDIEKPNDISGVVYTDMDDSAGWKLELAKELKASSYTIDMNKIL
ncbi:nucleotide-binding protein [Listeria booriae]|nr:nucleotide-binding protein [Listeria booriae]